MRMKFLLSADGTRVARLRDVQSARLAIEDNHGFVAGRIVGNLRGGADPIVLAGYAAIRDTPEARNLPVRARADMTRLLHLLNGGRLSKGESWPSEQKGE